MAALVAADLGIEVVIYAPDDQGPANKVVRQSHVGAYDDKAKLEQFVNKVDVISYEFENVPVSAARLLETIKPVYPQPQWLERAQDRMVEKSFIQSKNIPTAGFVKFDPSMCGQIAAKDVIIKTCRGGYDGKGQWVVNKGDAYPDDLPNVDLIVEDRIDLDREVSVIICADQHGAVACYDVGENIHKNGILDTTTVPTTAYQDEAVNLAKKLIADEDFVGVLALELFVTKDGKLLANEMAPRPHNSGHWTIDACDVSQFEQQVRAACGLPLGSTTRHSDAKMINLIGNDIENLDTYLNNPNAHVHNYGKADIKSGRKMGHVTLLSKS